METGLNISTENGVLKLQFCNPKKMNTLYFDTLEKMIEVMEKAKNEDSIKLIYITGKENVFSAGKDFKNFDLMGKDDLINWVEKSINFFITYPKVIIAGVNGLAVGGAFTMLLTFDIVLASDKAIFKTPFVNLYLTPEFCSSLLFPLFLRKSNAYHILLNGQTMLSHELKTLGFVTKIFKNEVFEKEAYSYAVKCAEHDLDQLVKIKKLINNRLIEKLIEVNKFEAKQLRQCWENPKFQEKIHKFTQKPKF
jgi:enoyl-CoA hydratase/carnithine racemase